MNIGRRCFIERHYPDEHTEFRRLMVFCDANQLRMTFHEERGVLIGIKVYDRNNNVITASSRYTLFYSIPDSKIVFLDCNSWDDGLGTLNKVIGITEQKNDEDLISTLGSNIL